MITALLSPLFVSSTATLRLAAAEMFSIPYTFSIPDMLCLVAAEKEAEKEVRRLTLWPGKPRDTAAQVREWEAMTWVERLARLNAAASDGADGAEGSLGNCYHRTGDYGRAREMYEQDRAICEALGDRKGVATACGNLGVCMSSTGEYLKAISYFETQHAIAVELGLEASQASAAFKIGAAMRLHVRAWRSAAASPALSPAAGTSRVTRSSASTTGRSSASTLLEDRVKEAATWLKTARAAGHENASLQLAHLAFDAGLEDRALDHLKDYLSCRVAQGRAWCDGCSQRRGEDAPMLTCSGCRVARFCNKDHQKMASKSVAEGGNVWIGRHKDICGLLRKWRGVKKDGVSPDSLRTDLLAFLGQRQ